MSRAFDSVTEQLEDAGRDLLVEQGAGAFDLEALARHSYVPVGTVYERWGSRGEAIADIARDRLLPALDAMQREDDPQATASALRLLAAVLAAAADDTDLRPIAALACTSLAAALSGSR